MLYLSVLRKTGCGRERSHDREDRANRGTQVTHVAENEPFGWMVIDAETSHKLGRKPESSIPRPSVLVCGRYNYPPDPSFTYVADVAHLGPREHLLRGWIDLVVFSFFSNKSH